MAQGYVASLARPGGNITGLTSLSSSALGGKRLQLLKEIVPEASRVAVLWNPESTAKVLEFNEVQATREALGVTLQSLEVRGPDDFGRAFEAAAAGPVDALYTCTDPVTFAQRTRIVDFALKSRLPSIAQGEEFVAAGGLIAYGPNTRDLYGRAATFVDKILRAPSRPISRSSSRRSSTSWST